MKLTLIIAASSFALPFIIGFAQIIFRRRPWWSYRFKLACYPSSEDCWWLASSSSRLFEHTWSRAECKGKIFAVWQLPGAYWAARKCGASVKELSISWI